MKRLLWIDTLRALTIFWVIAYHYFLVGRELGPIPSYFWNLVTSLSSLDVSFFLQNSLLLIWRLGYQGVAIFLMLSGLGLTMSTLGRKKLNTASFYKKRLPRIIFPYWFAFFFTIAIVLLLAGYRVFAFGGDFSSQFAKGHQIPQFLPYPLNPGDLLMSFFVIPRILRIEWLLTLPVTLWFIALIMQFYLVFPLLFLIARRVPLTGFLVSCLLLTLLCRLTFVLLNDPLGVSATFLHLFFPFRLYEFSLGMVIGFWLGGRGEVGLPKGAIFTFSCLFLVAVGSILDGFRGLAQVFSGPLIVSGLAGLMVASRPLLTFLGKHAAILPYLGRHSYTLLILHDPVQFILKDLLDLGLKPRFLNLAFLPVLSFLGFLTTFWHKGVVGFLSKDQKRDV